MAIGGRGRECHSGLIIFAEEQPPRGQKHVQCRRDSGGAQKPHETHLDDEYGHDPPDDSQSLGIGEGRAKQEGAFSERGRDRWMLFATAGALLGLPLVF